MDNYRDLSYSTIAVAPAPPTTGLTLTVQTGDGAKFAVAPFNAFIAPADELPLIENAEEVRVTARAGDSFTVERHQGITVAQEIATGWQIYAGVSAKTISDLVALVEAETTRAEVAEASGAPKARPVHVITGSVEAVWGADYYCEAGANFELTIPTAVGHAGEDIRVRVVNGTHAVTVKGSQTIDGQASLIVGLEPEQLVQAATITSDGTVLHTF